MLSKICKKCGVEKSLDDYYIHNGMKDKHLNTCKKCDNKKTREYQIEHKDQMAKYSEKYRLKYIETYADYARNTKYKQNYGITIEDYNKMFDDQNGLCAICSNPESKGRSKHFHVDHDHLTGKIRGLLCSTCNTALGKFNDDINLINKAIKYLQKHNGRPGISGETFEIQLEEKYFCNDTV
jgi:hypothetical protein